MKAVAAKRLDDEWKTGQPRKFAAVEAEPFRWPTRADIADDYIRHWCQEAGEALAQKRLCKKTMECIASHTSRRDGICRLSDKALSSRTSDRSLASTKRDVQRLKNLGFLIAEYRPRSGRQGCDRMLKLSVPAPVFESQRIPLPKTQDRVSTYAPYVEPSDMGERRDV